MRNDCTKWKDQLLEAALTGKAAGALEEHLLSCADCAEELVALRARRERLDALLPLVAQGAEPAADFRARVLSAAEGPSAAHRVRPWRVWGLAGLTGVTVAALMISLAIQRRPVGTVPENELAAAEKLAGWRAPSDVLLETPGREILLTTPRLGASYLRVPVSAPGEAPGKRPYKADEEE